MTSEFLQRGWYYLPNSIKKMSTKYKYQSTSINKSHT